MRDNLIITILSAHDSFNRKNLQLHSYYTRKYMHHFVEEKGVQCELVEGKYFFIFTKLQNF